MTDVDVTECPECGGKGRYEGRVLIDGRGVYTCPQGHRWQDADEKPTNKGASLLRGLQPGGHVPTRGQGGHGTD